MSDNRKIRRRQRCPECGSLDIHQMGSTERHPEVKVQKLQDAMFLQEERHLEIEPVPVVQKMGFRKDDDRGNHSSQQLQQQASPPVVR